METEISPLGLALYALITAARENASREVVAHCVTEVEQRMQFMIDASIRQAANERSSIAQRQGGTSFGPPYYHGT